MLLAIDTSGALVSVAVCRGMEVLASCETDEPRQHVEQLVPFISSVMRQAQMTPAQVSHLVVGVGPGPFTGLRVGLVTALTLGFTWSVPVGGVCSLDALAWSVQQWSAEHNCNEQGQNQQDYLAPFLPSQAGARPVVVATDARRREVYWSAYQLVVDPDTATSQEPLRLLDPQVSSPTEVGALVGAATGVSQADFAGRGTQLYASFKPALTQAPLDASAAAVAQVAALRLAAGTPLAQVQPLYLRRPDAQPNPRPSLVVS